MSCVASDDVPGAGRVVDVAEAELDRVVRPERRLGAAADRLGRVAGRVELVRDDDLARVERFVERERDVDEVQLPGRVLDRVVDAARQRGLRDHGAGARVDRREQHDLGADDDARPQRDAVGQPGRREDAAVVADVVARGEQRRAAVVAAELELRTVDELIEPAQRVRIEAGSRAELAPLRGDAAAVDAGEQMVARKRIVAPHEASPVIAYGLSPGSPLYVPPAPPYCGVRSSVSAVSYANVASDLPMRPCRTLQRVRGASSCRRVGRRAHPECRGPIRRRR